LLSKEGVIKICDFGSSKVIDPNGKNTPYIVSRYYRAPELMLCLTKYTTAIDVWAAGCIMAELALLTPIFKGKTEGDQLFAIFRVLGSMSA
jgi:serine/threonine protein kinase